MKLTFFLLLFCSFRLIAGDKVNTVKEIKSSFSINYTALLDELSKLDSLFNAPADWDEIQTQFFASRLAYKRTELFFEYFDREFVKDHINGAPLPSIERKAPNLVIIDPSGFQRLEEAIEEQSALSATLAHQLSHKAHEFEKYIGPIYLTDRMVFEAMREELIRIAALGITGFDTPTTLNTFNENQVALSAIKETCSVYYSYMQEETIDSLNQLFELSTHYFKDVDFDSFDRFGFIQKIIQPLYAQLLHIQHALFIETKTLVDNHESSVNYEVTSIFNTDFLNYKYYSSYSHSGNEQERIELGKLLFFDPILSANNERACASCHQPEKAFSDGKKTPLAFEGKTHLNRNSPGLINSVFNTRFFWDARATTPEEQAEHVILSPNEFNSSYEEITTKLKNCPEYVALFELAYPGFKTINKYTIVASISAYVQSLRSFNSDFDKLMNGERVSQMEEIKEGFNLFAGKAACATCHFLPTFAGNVPPLYVDTETEVLAVPNTNDEQSAVIDPDEGRYANKRPFDSAPFYRFSFKTPTVRNIALTAPYMHNGVFNTLEEVVDFYDRGGGHAWGIAPEHTTLPADSLHLTVDEKNSLILFMKSLTDIDAFQDLPKTLPKSQNEELNKRKVGGSY